MGIDYGEQRIGIAISDSTHTFSFPKETYNRKNKSQDLKYIIEFCKNNDVGLIVFGNPLNMDGSAGYMSDKVHKFAKELQKKMKYTDQIDRVIDIVFIDERCSSIEALESMNFQETKNRKKKKFIDQIAASLILKSYLEQEKNNGRPNN